LSKLYVYPKLGTFEFLGRRLGGRGLGNLLITYARALVLAEKYKLELISPSWNSVKLGAILRGEKDARTYSDLFDKPTGVTGLKKHFLLSVVRRYPESELLSLMGDKPLKKPISRPAMIECSGHDGFFGDLVGYRSLIKNNLFAMLTDKNIKNINKHDLSDGIVVHIRMGDFQPVPSDLSQIKPWLNYRLPLSWYGDIIDKIRAYTDYTIPVYVCSDGKTDELANILCKENVSRVFAGNSISDIMALSSGAVMIGSGSSFSMWAAFLGGMPSIWFPNLHSSMLLEDGSIFEGEIGFDDPLPKKLLRNLKSIFHNV